MLKLTWPLVDMATSTNRLLTNVDFPVFVIEFIGPKHFFVGGGGGPSATGVPNGLVRTCILLLMILASASNSSHFY